MSFIKTMKGQAVEEGALVIDWPEDGLVKCFLPVTEIFVGPALTNLAEGISESSVPNNITVGTTCDGVSCVGLAMTESQVMTVNGDIGDNSFVIILAADTATDTECWNFGGATHKVASSSAGNAATSILMGSETMFLSGIEGSGVGIPDGEVDSLQLTIIDRENENCKFFTGTDGLTLSGTIDFKLSSIITKDSEFIFDGSFKVSSAPNCFGFAVLMFPKGIPTNIHEIAQYINTELRAGRKYNWLNKWLDIIEY